MRRRIPPWRRCLDCGCRCRGWAEFTTRCARCQKIVKARGALGLEPGGLAEETRRRRLERQLDAFDATPSEARQVEA